MTAYLGKCPLQDEVQPTEANSLALRRVSDKMVLKGGRA